MVVPSEYIIDEIRKSSVFDSFIKNQIKQRPCFLRNHKIIQQDPIIFFGESAGESEMGKYLKHPIDFTIKLKGEKCMENKQVNIEDLHIGQTVYLHGKTPGKITGINAEGGSNYIQKHIIVRQRGSGNKYIWEVKNITLSPEFDFSDWETVHSLHQELWEWLEYHTNCTKEDWPRWKENGGDVPSVENYCFYCEYTKYVSRHGVRDCQVCPGDWKVKGTVDLPPCVRGAFGIWEDSVNEDVIRKAARIIKDS